MQNTTIQTTGQNSFPVSNSTTRSSSSSEQKSTVSAENVDPYLQIFLSLLSQNQTGGDDQNKEAKGNASVTVQQVSSLQNVLSMLNLQSLADIQNAANGQTAANSQITENAQTATDLQSATSAQTAADLQSAATAQTATGLQIATGLQSAASAQTAADLQSAASAQTAADLQSAANAQTATNPQSAANAQTAADLQSAANAQTAADLQSAVSVQAATDLQSTVDMQSVADLLSKVNIQSVADLLSSVSKQSTADLQSTNGIQSAAATQTLSETQSSLDLQMLKGYILDALQKNDINEAQSQTTAKSVQALADSSNQAVTNTDTANNVKLENISVASGLTETQNTKANTGVLSNKATASENDTIADISSAKDNTETVSKTTESSSTTDSGKKSSDKDVDVKNYQGEVLQNKEISASDASSKTVEKTSEPNVSNQIATDVSKNLSLGNNEFTVKLKPESLGEITVKLTEENGKTTLSITTASASTAKLINDDLSALKDAVSQMNVHVNEAVAKSNETQQGSMQQFNMEGQTEQQYPGGQAHAHSTYAAMEDSDISNTEQISNQVQNVSAQKNSSSGMDTYI